MICNHIFSIPILPHQNQKKVDQEQGWVIFFRIKDHSCTHAIPMLLQTVPVNFAVILQ